MMIKEKDFDYRDVYDELVESLKETFRYNSTEFSFIDSLTSHCFVDDQDESRKFILVTGDAICDEEIGDEEYDHKYPFILGIFPKRKEFATIDYTNYVDESYVHDKYRFTMDNIRDFMYDHDFSYLEYFIEKYFKMFKFS